MPPPKTKERNKSTSDNDTAVRTNSIALGLFTKFSKHCFGSRQNLKCIRYRAHSCMHLGVSCKDCGHLKPSGLKGDVP